MAPGSPQWRATERVFRTHRMSPLWDGVVAAARVLQPASAMGLGVLAIRGWHYREKQAWKL